MNLLSDHIGVVARFARSANIERDMAQRQPLDGYIVTAKALDVVERVATVAATGSAGGAWSLTGPYGSGKSSLALLLDAGFGPSGSIQSKAVGLVKEVSPATADVLEEARYRHSMESRGFYRAVVTATREPLNRTVLRALHSAVIRAHGKIPPKTRFGASKALRTALSDAASEDPRRGGPAPATLMDIARCMAQEAPLLLIIDEFGKNLEAIHDGSGADPYLLQQLAEAGQGQGLSIFILTLQHLSFEEYLASADQPQRQEWAKVQGRFEDIPFFESAAQTRALISTAFNVDAVLGERIKRWARTLAKTMGTIGIPDIANPETLAACYPLHPLTAAVLPELCNRYGQHERTLFSFLTGPGPASAATFLAAVSLPPRGTLPSIGLDAVYDHFVAGGTATAGSSQSHRWSEIAIRLRDTHGLTEEQSRIAKTIAVLNLVSTTGTLRASRETLRLVSRNADKTVAGLEDVGLVTYRGFADEYRVWDGTDVDIRGILNASRARTQHRPLLEILSTFHKPQPVVAARHSAQHNLLRVFNRRYVDGGDSIAPLDPFSPYDGEALLVLNPSVTPVLERFDGKAKPVVAALPEDVFALDAAAREVAAVTEALEHDSVADDWVARRELSERLGLAKTSLIHAAESTFSSTSCRWVLLGPEKPTDLPTGRGSVALSAAADLAYPTSPTIRNEMLNRTNLTSQGAKARRQLIEGMVEKGDHSDLGLGGYGPEMAMYRSFLDHTDMHALDERNNIMTFCSPTDPTLKPAWNALQDEIKRAKHRRVNLDDVYAVLLSPPIGMKSAVIPVFVTVGLLAHHDEVAIYEHGTFQPILRADISERMVRNPGHFDIKHFANTTGARRQVVDELANRFAIRPRFRKHRVSNVLAIVGHLVTKVQRLDNYTRRTASLPAEVTAVRDIIFAAVEPDELLFETLPTALGLRPVPANTNAYQQTVAYADKLQTALDNLAGSYHRLLDELFNDMLTISGEKNRTAIIGQAASLENEILNPEVRAFVLTLANDTVETNAEWIQAIATVVTKKAPAEWSDRDRERFRHALEPLVAAFQRLVALHAEHKVAGGSPFDAYRVTVTRSDGTEYARLVGIDHDHRHQLNQELSETIAKLARITGSSQRAQTIMLALLGERLMPEQSHVPTAVEPNQTREKHG